MLDQATPAAATVASPEALAAAAQLAKRARSRTAQVRRSFVEASDTKEGDPPLARLLRGGRGGAVRLKTYLSMLWLAASPPHDVSYPARAWATLLDLPDPDVKGARRVNEAVKWLEEHRFLSVESVPGHPNRVTLLEESGQGSAYSVPGEAYNRLSSKGASPEKLAGHRYLQIPPEFWTSGWLAVLSPAAIAMYLVLLCEQGRDQAERELWFSPERARERYTLSAETRSVGLNELRRAQLLTVRRRPVGADMFELRRYRNVYMPRPARLREAARVPQEGDKP